MNNTEIQKIIETVDENNLALRNAIVAFDNVCNSQKEANRLLGLMLDIFEARFDMNRDEFHPDELEDYVSGATFLRRFGRGNGRINEAEVQITRLLDRASKAEDLIDGI